MIRLAQILLLQKWIIRIKIIYTLEVISEYIRISILLYSYYYTQNNLQQNCNLIK